MVVSRRPGLRPLPKHGPCFVCGTSQARNMGVTWYARDDGAIVTDVILTEEQQGPPGHAHGGALAALLDEAMGAAVWLTGHTVVAVNLEVQYCEPVPLDQPIHVEGRMVNKDGRAVHTQGEIRLADGTTAAIGRGVFVEAPQFFSGLLDRMRAEGRQSEGKPEAA